MVFPYFPLFCRTFRGGSRVGHKKCARRGGLGGGFITLTPHVPRYGGVSLQTKTAERRRRHLCLVSPARAFQRSAATGSQRKFANFLSKSRKIRKDFFYYISCYPGQTFSTFVEPFFVILSFFIK